MPGSWPAILTAPYTFVNKTLFNYYGTSAFAPGTSVTGTDLTKVTLRILVTLMEDAKYLVTVRDKELVIRVRPGAPGVDATPAVKTLAPHDSGTPRLTGVEFEHHGDHDEVVVSLSATPKYIETRSESGRPGARLPGHAHRRGARTETRRQRLRRARSRRLLLGDRSKHTVTFEAESDAELDSTRVSRRGVSLLWTLFKPGSMPTSVTGVARRRRRAAKGADAPHGRSNPRHPTR